MKAQAPLPCSARRTPSSILYFVCVSLLGRYQEIYRTFAHASYLCNRASLLLYQSRYLICLRTCHLRHTLKRYLTTAAIANQERMILRWHLTSRFENYNPSGPVQEVNYRKVGPSFRLILPDISLAST